MSSLDLSMLELKLSDVERLALMLIDGYSQEGNPIFLRNLTSLKIAKIADSSMNEIRIDLIRRWANLAFGEGIPESLATLIEEQDRSYPHAALLGDRKSVV